MATIDLSKPTKAHLPHLGQAYDSPFDQVYPYDRTGRWVADTTTGDLLYKLDKIDSGKKLDGTPSNLTGTDGDVTTTWPAFYYKTIYGTKPIRIISTEIPDKWGSNCPVGYKIHKAFVNPDGTIRPYFTFGAFKGHVIANQLRSIAGVIPTRSFTIATGRDRARQGRTTRHNIEMFYQISAIQMMFAVEFGTTDSQSACGRGKVDYPSTLPSGNESELTTGDTIGLGDRSGYLDVRGETNGKVSMSYRGIEDFWGAIWSFIDGLFIVDEGYWHTGDHTKLGTMANYTLTGATPLMGDTDNTGRDGYVTGMERITALDFAFLPNAIGANASTYYCDQLWSHRRTQINIAQFGGNWTYGSLCGVFCWTWNNVASNTYSSIGARLCYLPE